MPRPSQVWKEANRECRLFATATILSMNRTAIAALSGVAVSWSLLQVPSIESAKTQARVLEKRLADCSTRMLVTDFSKNHKHPAWVKNTWGPPSDIYVDIKNNDSLLYPYVIVIEFRLLAMGSGKSASRDEALSSTAGLPLADGKYRNVYLLGDEGLRLQSTELASSAGWEQRPRWGDACWDKLTP